MSRSGAAGRGAGSGAVFQGWADYYDAWYSRKDYAGEADFVLRLAERCGLPSVATVLDLGCGTGGHLVPLARRGVAVTGVDASAAMLRQARAKLASLRRQGGAPAARASRVAHGDVREYRDGRTYDLVVAMFAVVGYLTTNEDVVAGLRTARAHLAPGGLLVFDVWHGPAVLAAGPETRFSSGPAPDGRGTLLRAAVPALDAAAGLVRVRYHLLQHDGRHVVREVVEDHEMRFFFVQELRLLLEEAGFELAWTCPFMSPDAAPGTGDWNVAVAARALPGGEGAGVAAGAARASGASGEVRKPRAKAGEGRGRGSRGTGPARRRRGRG